LCRYGLAIFRPRYYGRLEFWRGAELLAETIRVHGTAIVIDGDGVLLRGPSGSGKSDLALRLIDSGTAILVTDDQTEIHVQGGALMMTAPTAIAGQMEVRGIGIIPVQTVPSAPLRLILDLVKPEQIDRLPEPKTETVLGHEVPVLALTPFEASAPAKVRAALQCLSIAYHAEAAE